MGMHFSLIAADASVDELRAAFSNTWPTYEVVATAGGFATSDAVTWWMDSHSEIVPPSDRTADDPGTMTFAFWPDGDWAVLMDPSYALACDEEKLATLSRHVGTVLSFVVESASGSASFCCYENGRMRREIIYSDGDVSHRGEPLPEEAGIDVDNFYMDETEALMAAFALSSAEDVPRPDGCQAICVVDHTDYSQLRSKPEPESAESIEDDAQDAAEPPKAKRPWWRFW